MKRTPSGYNIKMIPLTDITSQIFFSLRTRKLRKIMKKSDFFYDLPQELIAQHPAEPRDSSRLMVLDKKTGAVKHDIFRNIV